MLSQKSINDFKKIWKEEFKEDISDEKAEEKGLELLRFMKLIYKPIPKKIRPTNTPTPTFILSPTPTITPTAKPIIATTKIKKTINNKTTKTTPTPIPNKSLWRWLFNF